MVIDVLHLLFKNKQRQYINIFKKNKAKWILGALMGMFSILFELDFIEIAVRNYFPIVTLVCFLYCIAKIFQDIPIMNIDYKLIEFKIINLFQLKMLIILKSVILSSFIFVLMLVFASETDKIAFFQALVLILINVVINFVCFLKSQTNHTDILTISTLLIVSLAFYLNSIVIISAFLGVIVLVFFSKKYFKYDRLLPYYHSMAYVYQGLVNSDMGSISQGQVQLMKPRNKSLLNFMEKYYSSDWFDFWKEISRAIYYYRKILNASLISFLITLITLMYEHPLWVNGAAMFALVFVADTVLTLLNKPEAINISKGFYVPFSLKDLIKQKYVAHICVVLFPLLSSLLILKYVSFVLLIICFLILPLKNILSSFSSKFISKCAVYFLESIILLACFINVI